MHQFHGAFNALLKTLEEPPPHAIFVAGHDRGPQDPATVVSRCQRYDFRRVPVPTLMALLRGILGKEGLQATDEALNAIARAAEGGVRDSESILDELITYCEGEITFQDVSDVLGLVDWQIMHDLCDAILAKDVTAQLLLVERVTAAGKDLSQFIQELLRYFRNLLVCKTANVKELLHLPEEELEALQARAARVSLTHLIQLVEQFAELANRFDSQIAQRIALEALLIRISRVGGGVHRLPSSKARGPGLRRAWRGRGPTEIEALAARLEGPAPSPPNPQVGLLNQRPRHRQQHGAFRSPRRTSSAWPS